MSGWGEALEGRLLAEALRLHEEALGEVALDPAAEAAALRLEGADFEARLIARARALPQAAALGAALRQLRASAVLALIAGVLLAVAGGATAARAALGMPGSQVNILWALGGLLGLQFLALLTWLALLPLRPRGTLLNGTLGSALLALGRRLNRWLHRGPQAAAALQAVARLLATTSCGRWTVSALSHVLWLAFSVGALGMLLLALSVGQYDFVWGTTLLSEQTYVVLTQGLAAAPAALGFPVPDAGVVRASRMGAVPVGRELWSGLLLGAVVAYGVLPRAVLLLLCGGLARRAARAWRLDLDLPGYARLKPRLDPEARALGVVDPERTTRARPAPRAALTAAGDGPPAVLGLELDPPANWPPSGLEWLDLGLVDSREQRQQSLRRLAALAVTPCRLVVAVSLLRTPDRGTQSFLRQLRAATPAPLLLLLSDGQRLRQRGDGAALARRLADWRALAEGVGGVEVMDLDLEPDTAASQARLRAAVLGQAVGGREP